MMRLSFQRLSKVSSLIILVSALFTAPIIAGAGFWGDDDPNTLTLDDAVSSLCESLADQVNLRREPVLISTNDFFAARTKWGQVLKCNIFLDDEDPILFQRISETNS